MTDFAGELQRGSATLGVALSAGAVATLTKYLQMLMKWNRTFNLTAIRDESKLVSNHLLDSLAVVKHLQIGSVIDVGSGAGLPGFPIAIADPVRRVQLLDSNQKKVAFLRQVVLELELPNVSVVGERVENYRPPESFGNVISRAFSDLPDFVSLAGHLCHQEGQLLAMKGLYPHEELARLPREWTAEQILPLRVPDLVARRHLVVLRASQTKIPA